VNSTDYINFFDKSVMAAVAPAASGEQRAVVDRRPSMSMKNIRTITKMRLNRYDETIKELDDDFDIKKRQNGVQELRKYGGVRGKVASILPKQPAGAAVNVSESIDTDSIKSAGTTNTNKSNSSMSQRIRFQVSIGTNADQAQAGDVFNNESAMESDSQIKQTFDATSLIDYWVEDPIIAENGGGMNGDMGFDTVDSSAFGNDGTNFNSYYTGDLPPFNNSLDGTADKTNLDLGTNDQSESEKQNTLDLELDNYEEQPEPHRLITRDTLSLHSDDSDDDASNGSIH